jgi:hypothetical protein
MSNVTDLMGNRHDPFEQMAPLIALEDFVKPYLSLLNYVQYTLSWLAGE